MPTRLILAFACAQSLLIPAGAASQTADALPKISQISASTRAMALGDAYTIGAPASDVLFVHPSLVGRSRGFGLAVQRWGGSATATAFSGAMQWLGGGVAVGIRTLQYGAPGVGVGAAPAGQDHLFDFGPSPVSETVATLGYSRSGPLGVSLGAAVHLVDERVGSDRQGVTLFDLSAARAVGPLLVALTAYDIGTKPLLEGDTGPSHYELGVEEYRHRLGPLDMGYAARLGWADGSVTWGAGAEVGYWPVQGRTFVARLGLSDAAEGSDAAPVSMGFAFWGDNLIAEWAFRPYAGQAEGGTHRIGIGWR